MCFRKTKIRRPRIDGYEYAADDRTDRARDLAGRVGSIIGSALACEDIARPGQIGDTGTPDATVPVPYALERRMLLRLSDGCYSSPLAVQ